MLLKVFKRKRKKTVEGNIVILGPSKAGKTTLTRYLETEEPVEEDTRSTLGIEFRRKPVNIGDWSFELIDTGGQSVYRNVFWQLGVNQAIAIVYLIDGTIKPDPNNEKQHERFKDAVTAFNYMTSFVHLGEIPILIVINKQDLKAQNPMNLEEAKKHFDLDKVLNNNFSNVFLCSAKYGNGIGKAMMWLGTTLEKLFNLD